MFFLHPMWDSETQRIGMQKCWPLGYTLHAVGELIGFIGLLALAGVVGSLIFIGVSGNFTAVLWLWLLIPFGMGIVSEGMVQISWRMVNRRGFRYDYEKGEASWNAGGRRVTYRYGQSDYRSFLD